MNLKPLEGVQDIKEKDKNLTCVTGISAYCDLIFFNANLMKLKTMLYVSFEIALHSGNLDFCWQRMLLSII